MKQLKYLVLIISLLSIKPVMSQAMWIFLLGDKVSTEKFQMGMNLSLTSSWLRDFNGQNYHISWGFGGFAEVKLNDKWSFQPETLVKSPGGEDNIKDYQLKAPLVDSLFTSSKTSIKLTYFSVPLYIKYKTKYVGFGFGPQIGLLYRAQTVFKGEGINGDNYQITENILPDTYLFDYGITGLLEFYLVPKKKLMSMRIGIKYYYGISPISKYDSSIHNSTFLFTVGIPIGDESKTNK